VGLRRFDSDLWLTRLVAVVVAALAGGSVVAGAVVELLLLAGVEYEMAVAPKAPQQFIALHNVRHKENPTKSFLTVKVRTLPRPGPTL
jgi:hypothetical protein